MDKIIKIVAALFAVIVVAGVAVWYSGTAVQNGNGTAAADTIFFFYGEECPHCHNVMPFIGNMTRKYPGVNIRVLEVWHNETNQQIYQQANAAAGIPVPGVPEIVLGKTVLIGERDIPAKLEGLIQDYLKKKS